MLTLKKEFYNSMSMESKFLLDIRKKDDIYHKLKTAIYYNSLPVFKWYLNSKDITPEIKMRSLLLACLYKPKDISKFILLLLNHDTDSTMIRTIDGLSPIECICENHIRFSEMRKELAISINLLKKSLFTKKLEKHVINKLEGFELNDDPLAEKDDELDGKLHVERHAKKKKRTKYHPFFRKEEKLSIYQRHKREMMSKNFQELCRMANKITDEEIDSIRKEVEQMEPYPQDCIPLTDDDEGQIKIYTSTTDEDWNELERKEAEWQAAIEEEEALRYCK